MKNKIKVMHINVSYGQGGAGIAARRLYDKLYELYNKEFDFRFLCIDRVDINVPDHILCPLYEKSKAHRSLISNNKKIQIEEIKTRTQRWIETYKNSSLGKIHRNLLYSKKYPRAKKYGSLYSTNGKYTEPSMLAEIEKFQPDIIHLHWIIFVIAFQDIKRLVEEMNTKIVWTTHDMWPYTGGCHYNLIENITEHISYKFCNKWEQGCSKCPNINGNLVKDSSYEEFNLRKALLQNTHIVFVSPAKWAQTHLNKSALFNNNKTFHIPNPYNIETFTPINKEKARTHFNLPLDKKILLIGNIYSTVKGRTVFLNALFKLNINTSELIIVEFGANDNIRNNKYQTISIGKIEEEHELSLLYSASDAIAVPSIIDIGPSTAIESMLCATPVVAFNAFGPSEFIEHKKDGYLADPYNVQDLANGLHYVLKEADATLMQQNARKKAVSIFDDRIIAQKYSDIYRNIS